MYYEAALSGIQLCGCRYLPSFTLFGKNFFYTKQMKDGQYEKWALAAMSSVIVVALAAMTSVVVVVVRM